jgi:8-amino-7-oxononanoate synthase
MTRYLKEKLLKREREGNLRQLHLFQNLIDFSSNDYLGLASSSSLASTVAHELSQYKPSMGSTGSRLLTGNSRYAQDLEDRVAAFHGFDAGLLFNCGYMANVGLLSTIAGSEDCIFFDAGVHASTHDGICLSQASAFPFRHNDIMHLENRLKNCQSKGDRFICIESIYSTDGSMAPLVDICRLAKAYEAHLIVDEAHAVGVCGNQGRGLVAEHNLCACVFAQIVTFGKAIGAHGAIVLGSHFLKQSLMNFATACIYTTALPMQSLVAINGSYNLFPGMEYERQHLKKLVQSYRDSMPNASETHIQSIPVAGNEAAKKFSREIIEAGFDVRPLLSPTVRRGKEMLRICLHAFNTESELKTLMDLTAIPAGKLHENKQKRPPQSPQRSQRKI